MIDRFSESVAESAALAWRFTVGYAIISDSLPPKLIASELRVKDAEGIIGVNT